MVTHDDSPCSARVLVVDADPDGVLNLRAVLQDDYDVVGAASGGDEALRLIARFHPDVVVTELTLKGMDGLEMTRVINERYPETLVVVVSSQHQADDIRAAMAAGAREYLFKPVVTRELLGVMGRVCRRKATRHRLLEAAEGAPGGGIWAFCSAVGGTGQTTLLLSLANELLLLGGRGVLVADLDLTFGDVAFYMGMDQVPPTMNELLEQEKRLDGDVIQAHCRAHASGLRLLLPSGEAAASFGLDRRAAADVVLASRRLFDYVLVDLPLGLSEAAVPVLDEAQFIFTTSNHGLASFKNMCRLLGIFDELEYPRTKIRPVLTGFQEGTMPLREYERVVQKNNGKLARVFRHDRESCDQAVRAGQPVSRVAPQSAYTQAVRDFLLALLELPPDTFRPRKAQRRSLLERFFG